jgi:crotonobetainyl-CoA:carnitine CoA-transferase CaiB-like acyl-CoA transferase
MLLADLGADVIMIERPEGGDPTRQFPAFHASLARNKRSVAIDIKTETGRAILLDLVEQADILIEGFRPGTMDRLGFGYSALSERNPRLIYASISGFGQTGPYRDRPAHDLSYQAMAGLLHRNASVGLGEKPTDLAIGDLSSGMFAALGVLAALHERNRTERGRYIDVSMTDGLVSWMTVMAGPQMNGGAIADFQAEPAYGLFEAGDGKPLTLSIAHEDWFWRPLCALLDMADCVNLDRIGRTERRLELRSRIAKALATEWRDVWAAKLDAAGIPWGPVNTIAEVTSDPHFRARGLFQELSEAQGSFWYVAQPLVVDGERPRARRGAPSLGEHTDEIRAEISRRRVQSG